MFTFKSYTYMYTPLRHGADLGLESGDGRTIAVEAAARGHADVLRLLLAPVNGGDDEEEEEEDDDNDDVAIQVGGGVNTVGGLSAYHASLSCGKNTPVHAPESSAWFHQPRVS